MSRSREQSLQGSRVRGSAFVIMPFDDPYDAYYGAIFRPALIEIGYSVSRADELRRPRPIILDIHEQILDADVIVCELSNKNPNVFYELGLAHAIGKPVVLVSHEPDEIPFDVSHIRAVTYDFRMPGWEDKLSADIQAAVRAIESGGGDEWPPPLIGTPARTWTATLANEIELNLARVDRFVASEYRVDDDGIVHDTTGSGVLMDAFSCTTAYYDAAETQERIQALDEAIRSEIHAAYEHFRTINMRADALGSAWRAPRAQQFARDVYGFVEEGKSAAERAVKELRT